MVLALDTQPLEADGAVTDGGLHLDEAAESGDPVDVEVHASQPRDVPLLADRDVPLQRCVEHLVNGVVDRERGKVDVGAPCRRLVGPLVEDEAVLDVAAQGQPTDRSAVVHVGLLVTFLQLCSRTADSPVRPTLRSTRRTEAQSETFGGSLRSRSAWRPVTMTLLLAGTVVACGGSDVKITNRPEGHASAHALATAVAKQAGCGFVEDSSLPRPDRWDFSCQFGRGSTFDIRTATSSRLRDGALPTGLPYVLGDFYLVVPVGPGAVDFARLRGFPGQLVTS